MEAIQRPAGLAVIKRLWLRFSLFPMTSTTLISIVSIVALCTRFVMLFQRPGSVRIAGLLGMTARTTVLVVAVRTSQTIAMDMFLVPKEDLRGGSGVTLTSCLEQFRLRLGNGGMHAPDDVTFGNYRVFPCSAHAGLWHVANVTIRAPAPLPVAV